MERFYWPKMIKDINAYVGSCERCLRTKATVGQKPHGLLNPLEVPTNRWKDISIDFMTKLVIKAKIQCKHHFDKNRYDCKFYKDEKVLLDTRNLKLEHLLTTGKRKWSPKFIGPFSIIKETTPNTYQIKLPPKLKLHNEFHVSYLRKYPVTDSRVSPVSSVILSNGDTGYLVKRITDKRIYQGEIQYKVEWLGYSPEESTWEPKSNLNLVTDFIDDYENSVLRRQSSTAVKTGKVFLREDCHRSG